MKVGLFIPCYVNQFYPHVGIATYQLLKKFDLEIVYPLNQTCCGQPMANSGYEHLTGGCNKLFINNFSNVDYIVSPSGSCVLHIKEHLTVKGMARVCERIRNTAYELTEFLIDILKVEMLVSEFPYRVGLHQSCHAQRGLKISQMSELVAPGFSKPEKLLNMVKGITLVPLNRQDECCGFGGTFCVTEEAVSVKMGKDRITDHVNNASDFITGNDMSCLMHLDGILKRSKSKIKTIHIAEILNGGIHAQS